MTDNRRREPDVEALSRALAGLTLETLNEDPALEAWARTVAETLAAAIESVFPTILELVNRVQDMLRPILEAAQGAGQHGRQPRAPKRAGPSNRGRLWALQPARTARSCCRRKRKRRTRSPRRPKTSGASQKGNIMKVGEEVGAGNVLAARGDRRLCNGGDMGVLTK